MWKGVQESQAQHQAEEAGPYEAQRVQGCIQAHYFSALEGQFGLVMNENENENEKELKIKKNKMKIMELP